MTQHEIKNKEADTNVTEEEHSLKGTFYSVMFLGVFIILSWAGVWWLFISR